MNVKIDVGNVKIDVDINVTVKELLVLCITESPTTSIRMHVGCFEVEGTAASILKCMSREILDKEVKGIDVANYRLRIQAN